MKAYYIFIIVALTFSSSCKTRSKTNPSDLGQHDSFKNQGEQERYWAAKLFESDYKRQVFNLYKEQIKISKDTLWYGVNFLIVKTNAEFKNIFSTGLIYPALLSSSNGTISDIEELKELNPSVKIKRFRFLFWGYLIANPTVYFFELKNADYNRKKSNLNFIKNQN